MADIQKLESNLRKRGIQLKCFDTADNASSYLDQYLDQVSIGFGGSVTVRDMGLYEKLSTHNHCYWHWMSHESDILSKAASADIYISSLNAVTENGELVNIDGVGNRVASSVYGHKKVIFIIGENKITSDMNQAVERARSIAAPPNAKRLGRNTPCAATGQCIDCNAKERICKALMVLWGKPTGIDEMELILIRQNLGY